MLTRRGMATILSLLLWVSLANGQEKFLRTKQSALASKISEIDITYPNLKLELQHQDSPRYEIELKSVQPTQFEVIGQKLRLKKTSGALAPEKKQAAPLLIVKIKGPSQKVQVISWKLESTVTSWSQPLSLFAQDSKLVISQNKSALLVSSDQIDLQVLGGLGSVQVSSQKGQISFEKYQGDLQYFGGETNLTVKDSDMGIRLKSYAGQIDVIDSKGRIDARLERTQLEVVKFAGVGEFDLRQGRVKLVSHKSGRLHFRDQKSRFEILKEGPAWLDLRSESGAFSVDPLKPVQMNHEVIAQGFSSEIKGGGYIKINTQSGRVILK